MTRGIDNNLPRGADWVPKKLYQLNDAVMGLLSGRRILNKAVIDSGGIEVINNGAVTVNPGGTSVALKTLVDPASGTAVGSEIAFGSSDPSKALRSAAVVLADGTNPEFVVQGFPNGNGDAAALFLFANIAEMQASDTPSGGLAHVGVAAGASSPYPAGAVLLDAGSAHLTFHGDGVSTYYDTGFLRWVAVDNSVSVQEFRAQTTSSAYVPIRAAAFTVTSSREVKTDIVEIPFDALGAVMAAEPMQWSYDEAFAADPNPHVSPMAEDLPTELVHEADGVKSIDPLSLTGTLWEAVRQLSAQVAAQQELIEEIRALIPERRAADAAAEPQQC